MNVSLCTLMLVVAGAAGLPRNAQAQARPPGSPLPLTEAPPAPTAGATDSSAAAAETPAPAAAAERDSTASPPAKPAASAAPSGASAPPAREAASSFGSGEDFSAPPSQPSLTLKMYGDTHFQVRNHADVHDSFAAPHLDLFGNAEAERLAFMTEVFFEADDNEIAVDVERMQVTYLFANWLRLRMGRTHTAFGYYNDTYHHGNLFELTTTRPYAAQFEDAGGLFTAHLVGLGGDGTFELSGAGQLRYDIEVGNGRSSDTTSVAIEEASKDVKLVNVRLRWLPTDALILGVNALHDQIPSATVGVATRPKLDELIAGVHVVYLDHGVHALLEAYAIRHAPSAGPTRSTYGGFMELGYAIGQFTPYFRSERIQFPRAGDLIFQADDSPYFGVRIFVDYRLGLNWQPLPQLALKLEGQELQVGSNHQELATFKAAFGF